MTVSNTESQSRAFGAIDQALHRGFDRWVSFWFTPADPAPLCAIRLLIGGMVLYSHLIWGLELQAFFGHDGWNSDEVIRAFQFRQSRPSFWWFVPDESMQTVHQWCIGILVLFWLGCLTRVTSVLALVIHVSYCQRAAIATFGLDQICGILLLYLAIAPCGAAYSVDSLLMRCWRSFRKQTPYLSNTKSVSAGLALRLMQFHYCVIYFFAAVGKLQGESWWDGSAMWRSFANYEYQSIDMTRMARFPELLQLITHIIVVWELSFAYLIWVKPLRPLMLWVGVLMHLGIGAFLGMWTFGSAMIFGYVCFLQPETVRTLVEFPARLFRRKTGQSGGSGLT